MSPPPPSANGTRPHVALLPSSGMGHLTPFLRLAATLASRGCHVTLVTPDPAVTAAESRHIADFVAAASPLIRSLQFRLPPVDLSTAASNDPFFLQFEAIRRSAHLLGPLLAAASPSLSAVVTDISITSHVVPVTAALGLPNYVLFTSSAVMLALCAALPHITVRGVDAVEIPGVPELPVGWLPQPLRNPGHLFTIQVTENGGALVKTNGVLVNTWEAMEPETLAALNAGKVVPELPPVTALGPLLPVDAHGDAVAPPWLDEQPERSVVYVSFGSRTAMSPEQIRELGVGLERSGCRFLWVVKTRKVDKEEAEAAALEELLGDGYLKRVEGRGLVVKDWVNQQAVLSHPAVGGFVSHCGWNSVTEAAAQGLRVLAWPRHGDQRLNAQVVEKAGLGAWVKEWSWEGDAEVVGGEEIGWKVSELMESAATSAAAARVKEAALRAVAAGGTSHKALEEFLAKLTPGSP